MKKRRIRMVAINRITQEEILVNPGDEKDIYWSLDKRQWNIMVKKEGRMPKIYSTIRGGDPVIGNLPH